MRYPQTAALIKSARRRKGWSQERAAVAVGCSRLQFIRWEQGLHRPSEHAAELVDTLGVDKKALEAADSDESEAASVAPLVAALTAAIHAVVNEAVRERVT